MDNNVHGIMLLFPISYLSYGVEQKRTQNKKEEVGSIKYQQLRLHS